MKHLLFYKYILYLVSLPKHVDKVKYFCCLFLEFEFNILSRIFQSSWSETSIILDENLLVNKTTADNHKQNFAYFACTSSEDQAHREYTLKYLPEWSILHVALINHSQSFTIIQKKKLMQYLSF